MRDADELLSIAEAGVKLALAKGADAAEVYVAQSRALTLAANGAYAAPKASDGVGVAVRVARGQRLGVGGGSGLDLEGLVARAVDAADRLPASGRFVRFADPADTPLPPTPVDRAIAEVDPARLEDAAEAAMAGLTSSDATAFAAFSITSSMSRFAIANSEGVATWDQRGSELVQYEARVERGTTRLTTADHRSSDRPITDVLDIDALPKSSVERAAQALEATRLDGPVDAAIFDAGPAAQLVRLFAQGLSANLVQGKQSPFTNQLGTPVASPTFTLRDVPHGMDAPQRRRIDHEGSPTMPLDLVEEGVLRNYLYDSLTARIESRASTGHGLRRSGWSGGVGIAPTHLHVSPGSGRLDALFADADRALYVSDPFAGSFTSNATTGDFSLVAPFAFLVERGEVTSAVHHVTIGGNVHRVLSDVRGIGVELHEYHGGTFPALHVGGVSCAN